MCLQLFGFQQDNRGVNPHGIKVRLHGPTSNVPISQKPEPERIRGIEGSFAFIEPRFLRDGFLWRLSHHELLVYFFLVLACDRQGMSYYGYEKICSQLKLLLDDYIHARDALIRRDLIAFDGRLFQVLSLPQAPAPQGKAAKAPPGPQPSEQIGNILSRFLGGS